MATLETHEFEDGGLGFVLTVKPSARSG